MLIFSLVACVLALDQTLNFLSDVLLTVCSSAITKPNSSFLTCIRMKAFILQTHTFLGTAGIGIGLNAKITIIRLILKPMILNLNCQKVMFSHYTEAHNKLSAKEIITILRQL